MAEVNIINCPSCGSNSTFKTSTNNYACNYCQSKFVINVHENNLNSNPTQVYQLKNQNNPQLLKYVLIAVFVMVFLVGGIVFVSLIY